MIVPLVIALHVFGVIFWLGSLLVIASLLGCVPEEVGVAKERFIVAARRLFDVGGNIGAGATVGLGILLVLLEPKVMLQHWIHVKLLLVAVLLVLHVRLYRRIVALENEPASATRREFAILHGVVSVLLLAILVLVIAKPF
ncbi:MAG: CopD family protein [Candidatus Binataceae bacterium]